MPSPRRGMKFLGCTVVMRRHEGRCLEHALHIATQRCRGQGSNVEIHVLGVADAPVEEAEVAPALQREQRPVHAGAERTQEQQVKHLYRLARGPHGRFQ